MATGAGALGGVGVGVAAVEKPPKRAVRSAAASGASWLCWRCLAPRILKMADGF